MNIKTHSENCSHCMKCIKLCPVGALMLQNGKPTINENLCIDCGKCLSFCEHQGFSVISSPIDTIENYDYRCILIPASIYTMFSNAGQVNNFIEILKDFGFNEVIDLSYYNHGIMQIGQEFISKYHNDYLLSVHCPTITRMIYQLYPSLVSKIIPLNYPSEIAAIDIKKRISEKLHLHSEKIGVFTLCECISKLDLAKYPNNNLQYVVDHALSLSDLSAAIHSKMTKMDDGTANENNVVLSYYGLLYPLKDGMQRLMNHDKVVNVDSIERSREVLELLEFNQIKSCKYFSLSACANGCVGGNLLWKNAFENRISMEYWLANAVNTGYDIKFEDALIDLPVMNDEDIRTMKEKMEWFIKVNEVFESLPKLDCGACGYPSCKQVAKDIVKGKIDRSICRIKEDN